MKKILSVISGNIESGGVETYLKNVYERINFENLQIDILVPGKIIYEPYAKAYRTIGCTLKVLNISQNNKFRYIKLYQKLNQILKKEKYNLIHINTCNITIQALILAAAKRNNIPERISHSHGTMFPCGNISEYIRNIMRSSINKNTTLRLACSQIAAESLFSSKYVENTIIAKNGIEVDKYIFDKKTRNLLRKKNGWKDFFIIGSVGRLSHEKNYKFVLYVFTKTLKKCPNAKLVIAGDGEELESLHKLASTLGILNNIEFLGIRKDIPELMQCFDVFVLASKREALGIVNIEAQATGLPCVVSDAIPKEVNITGLVHFLSLNEKLDVWSEEIRKVQENTSRTDHRNILKQKGYDLADSYQIIDNLYHGKINR